MSTLHSETNTTVNEWVLEWLETDSNPRGFAGSCKEMLELHALGHGVKRDPAEVNLLTVCANIKETGRWIVANGHWVKKDPAWSNFATGELR